MDESVIQNREDRRPGMPGNSKGHSKDAPHIHRSPMFGMDEEFMNKLFQQDKQKHIRQYYKSSTPGTLSQQTLDDLKLWSDNQHVFYWLGDINQIENLLTDNFTLEVITEMEVPSLNQLGTHPKGPPHFDDDKHIQSKLTLVKAIW